MPDSLLHITGEHDRPSFERVEGAPDPRLAGLVHRYAGYSHRSARSLRRREPAQDMVTLILGFDSPIRVSGPGSAITEASSFVAALDDRYAITEERRTPHGMQVDLSPLGAYMLLGVPMRDLSELIVPFEHVTGAPATQLIEQLFLTRGWESRFRLLDAFILARFQEARPPFADITWAWRRLSETGGRLPISALAEELGCSRRHLTARFREQVGPTPKAAARILRFARAKKMLSGDGGQRFAEIALDCGYYDQAHLNRDFRQMAGTTPSDFLAGQMPDGFGVSA
jgi:AraC-like DNA-binding protein